MKRFERIFSYVGMYKSKLFAYILYTVLGTLFGIVSLAMLSPFVSLIVSDNSATQSVIKSNAAGSYISNFLNTIMANHGKIYALAAICAFIIIATLLKNLFLYLSNLISAPIRSAITTRFRNDLYEKILVLPVGYFTEQKKGDIISKFDGKYIDSRSAFDELLSYHRPGDKVKIILKVDTKEKEIEITLNNDKGVPSLETNSAVQSKSLGASFEEISKIEKERFKLLSGIRLFNIKPNGLISRLNLPENFIVTSFNYQKFNKPEELIKVLETVRGKILFEGINPNGTKGYYQSMIY